MKLYIATVYTNKCFSNSSESSLLSFFWHILEIFLPPHWYELKRTHTLFSLFHKQTVLCTSTGTDQNLIDGCQNFLKKHKLCRCTQYTTNQNFNIWCLYFSCYLFASFWHFTHMSLPYLSSDSLIFFCFLLCVLP